MKINSHNYKKRLSSSRAVEEEEEGWQTACLCTHSLIQDHPLPLPQVLTCVQEWQQTPIIYNGFIRKHEGKIPMITTPGTWVGSQGGRAGGGRGRRSRPFILSSLSVPPTFKEKSLNFFTETRPWETSLCDLNNANEDRKPHFIHISSLSLSLQPQKPRPSGSEIFPQL